MDLTLQTIIDSLEAAVICLDEKYEVVFLSVAAARLFDCPQGSEAAKSAVNSAGLASFLEQLSLSKLHLSEDSPRCTRHLQAKKASGQSIPIEALVTRTKSHGKKLYIVDVRDVSIQQQIARTLEQSRKSQAISMLTGGIAHDFNNVLTGVISHLELALASRELPQPLRGNLNQAKTCARLGADLVKKLQGFTRLTKSRITELEIPCLLEQIVAALTRNFAPRIQIRLANPDEETWPIRGDVSQLLQALMNIALNACDAMGDGGELSFAVSNVTFHGDDRHRSPRRAGEFVRVSLSASGRGLPPEAWRSLLGCDLSSDDPGVSAGQGSSGTAGVLSEHRGWVEVEAGHGKQLHVFLPRCSQSGVVASTETCFFDAATRGQCKERILVVDDEELVRMVIRAVLGYRGYQVTETQDGESALQEFFNSPEPYDLVLMDLYMPGMDGREALMRIRRRNPAANAIMLSASLPETENSPELRGVRFLEKPFENKELLRLVREVLDSSPQRAEAV